MKTLCYVVTTNFMFAIVYRIELDAECKIPKIASIIFCAATVL